MGDNCADGVWLGYYYCVGNDTTSSGSGPNAQPSFYSTSHVVTIQPQATYTTLPAPILPLPYQTGIPPSPGDCSAHSYDSSCGTLNCDLFGCDGSCGRYGCDGGCGVGFCGGGCGLGGCGPGCSSGKINSIYQFTNHSQLEILITCSFDRPLRPSKWWRGDPSRWITWISRIYTRRW